MNSSWTANVIRNVVYGVWRGLLRQNGDTSLSSLIGDLVDSFKRGSRHFVDWQTICLDSTIAWSRSLQCPESICPRNFEPSLRVWARGPSTTAPRGKSARWLRPVVAGQSSTWRTRSTARWCWTAASPETDAQVHSWKPTNADTILKFWRTRIMKNVW